MYKIQTKTLTMNTNQKQRYTEIDRRNDKFTLHRTNKFHYNKYSTKEPRKKKNSDSVDKIPEEIKPRQSLTTKTYPYKE